MLNEGQLTEHTEEGFQPGVCYDGDNVRLEGLYPDELSAWRAKRVWKSALESYFLLECENDIEFDVQSDPTGSCYKLLCDFKTACARYAFWRITNGQTPEAQYLIETAHIPDCDARKYDFLTAADLRPTQKNEPTMLAPANNRAAAVSILTMVKRLVHILGNKSRF